MSRRPKRSQWMNRVPCIAWTESKPERTRWQGRFRAKDWQKNNKIRSLKRGPRISKTWNWIGSSDKEPCVVWRSITLVWLWRNFIIREQICFSIYYLYLLLSLCLNLCPLDVNYFQCPLFPSHRSISNLKPTNSFAWFLCPFLTAQFVGISTIAVQSALIRRKKKKKKANSIDLQGAEVRFQFNAFIRVFKCYFNLPVLVYQKALSGPPPSPSFPCF